MKYIDAEKLIKAIEDKGLDCSFAVKMVRLDTLALIDELQQEQPDLPSGEEVMTTCNQILIDWVKEGKTPEEKVQRKQAHSRFFELYDEYLMQEQPEFPTTDEEVEKFLATAPNVELPKKYENPDWLFKKQAQPDVDLEMEIERIVKNEEKFMKFQVRHQLIGYVARHFYELARQKYEK